MESVAWVIDRFVECAFASWESFMAAMKKMAGLLTDLDSGLAWPYVASTVLIAGGVFWHARRREGRVQSFARFLLPREIYGHPSAVVDYKFFLVNHVLRVLFMVPIIIGMNLAGYKLMSALVVDLCGWEPPSFLSAPILFTWLFAVFVLHDLVTYGSHVLFHRVPALWQFHQIHHAAEVLTPITAARTHPVELLFGAAMQAPVVGFAFLSIQGLPDATLAVTMVSGVSIFSVIYNFTGHHLAHSHIPLSFGPLFDRILISPVMHQMHHSSDPKHWDKNFGLKFSLWDGLFGTRCFPAAGGERLQFGLVGMKKDDFATVGKLYVGPFQRAGGLIGRCFASGPLTRSQDAGRSEGL
jgi:sterol desaturase/sphingolipid hydroxylase (fatty acid hydroxylase superfamily)